MMNIFSKYVGIISVAICISFFLEANASDSFAMQEDTYDTINADEILSRQISPLAEEISKLLLEVSPRKDGKVLPVFLKYPFSPIEPGNVQRVSFYCPWGQTACATFIQHCAAALLNCHCDDYGSEKPDPC